MPIYDSDKGSVSVSMFGWGNDVDDTDVEQHYTEYRISRKAELAMNQNSETKLWALAYENEPANIVTDAEYRQMQGDELY